MNVPKKTHLERLFHYFKRYRGYYLVGFFLLIATNSLALTIPWILKCTVNQVQAGITQQRLWLYLGAMIGVALIQALIRMSSRILIYTAGRNAEFDLRNDFYRHLLKLPTSFFQKIQAGDLMSRSINDSSDIRMFLGPGFLQVTNTVIAYTATIVLLCLINVKLALFALLPYPILILVVRNSTRSLHKKTRKVQEQLSKLSSKAQENFNNIHVIHSYVQENNQAREFKKLNQEYFFRNMEVSRLRARIWPLIRFLAGIAPLVILWMGSYKVINKEISLGDFVAFNSYLAMLVNPTIAFGWILSILERGYAAMRRINAVLNEEEEITLSAPLSITDFKGEIRVKNLSFAYPPQNGKSSPLVLKNIHFHLKPGQTLGILGRTGSGKSTLIKLLTRFYSVPNDTIYFDGVDVNRIDTGMLRSSMGVVPQTSFLFSTSVKENILYGQASQYVEELIRSATQAQIAHEIDQMPLQYDSVIGEKGLTLSGGQRQRMALGRALAISPKIMILDDSFSSVDSHTEEQILTNLKQRLKDVSTIIVSHRISTLEHADWIIVLDEGEIVEEGTPIYLKKSHGIYSHLYQLQQNLFNWEEKKEKEVSDEHATAP